MLAASAAPAAAQDVEKQISKMNKRAMEDYDALEFESARRTLIDAVALLRSSGLDEAPVAAKTYINLGIVYMSGFRDRNRGIQQFANALKIKADAKVPASVATPELEEAFAQAVKQVGVKRPDKAVTPPKVVEPTPPPAEEVKGLVHTPVDEARTSAPITIKAQLGKDTGAKALMLFYRAQGQEDFTLAPMRNTRGADWSATIPGDVVAGTAIQYYLDARDAQGNSVVGAGSAPNPYIIALSRSGPIADSDEDPLSGGGKTVATSSKKKFDRLFILVMPGFGFGVQPLGNRTEVAWRYNNATNAYERQSVDQGGLAWAPFHIAAEFGGRITKGFALSLFARIQLVSGANAESVNVPGAQSPTIKAFGAFAILARARYRFMNDGKFHPYVQANLGYGHIRHMVEIWRVQTPDFPLVDSYSAGTYNLDPAANKDPRGNGSNGQPFPRQNVCPSPNDCKDTIALGAFLVGAGAGIWYDVIPHLALIVDLNLLGAVGLPAAGVDGQSGFNIDLQLGLGATF